MLECLTMIHRARINFLKSNTLFLGTTVKGSTSLLNSLNPVTLPSACFDFLVICFHQYSFENQLAMTFLKVGPNSLFQLVKIFLANI
jgi:hypothetical protein